MLSLWSLCNGDKKDILSDISHNRVCQIHMTFLCASFIKILLVMFLGKTGKGFLAWNRQLFSNIIYVIQKNIEAINHITDTTDSWDVICNVKCYALFTDFSKIKQLQPTLTHVAKPKGTLQSASTASHVSKYWKIAILRCFGNYACVVNMMSIHTIYMLPQQQKTGAQSVLGDSKFVQIMNIQPKGEIAYHLTCIWHCHKENYRTSKTPRNLKYEYLAKVGVCSGLRW